MKKMIYLAFALLLMSATSMNAQVAIGIIDPDDSTAPELNPHPGAVLDLGQVYKNNLGLLLPKVMLTSATLWAPVVGTDEERVDGMMVFNESISTSDGLEGKGVYVWVNGSWNKISFSPFTQPDPEDVNICYGSTATLTLADATGGSGDITYIWEQSADKSTWVAAIGSNTNAEYTTPALTSNMYYHRLATCKSGTITSEPAQVSVPSSIGEVESVTSKIKYATYSYPNGLGIWTVNVKEPGESSTGPGSPGDGDRGYYYLRTAGAAICSNLGEGWKLPTKSQYIDLASYLGKAGSPACGREFWTLSTMLAGYHNGSTNNWMQVGTEAYYAHNSGYYRLVGNALVDSAPAGSNPWVSVRCIKIE